MLGMNVYTDFCARLGDSTEVIDHIGLGHANTSVPDGKNLVLLVGNNADVEFLFMLKRRRVGKRRIAYFVEGIRAVGDQLPQEDLFV